MHVCCRHNGGSGGGGGGGGGCGGGGCGDGRVGNVDIMRAWVLHVGAGLAQLFTNDPAHSVRSGCLCDLAYVLVQRLVKIYLSFEEAAAAFRRPASCTRLRPIHLVKIWIFVGSTQVGSYFRGEFPSCERKPLNFWTWESLSRKFSLRGSGARVLKARSRSFHSKEARPRYIYIYICISISLSLSIYIYIYISIYLSVSLSLYIYIYI